MKTEGTVGLVAPVSVGTMLPLRLGRTTELVKTDGRGRYAENTSRGLTFSATTTITGTTIVSDNNTPVAQAAATILTIYNPPGSNVNAELIKTWICRLTGTFADGYFVYNFSNNQNLTAVPNNNGSAGVLPQSNLSSLAGKIQAFTQTALVGGIGAQTLLRPIIAFFGGSFQTASWFNSFYDNVDGEIIVPPGGLLSIASPGTGTSSLVIASMTWMEIPIQSP